VVACPAVPSNRSMKIDGRGELESQLGQRADAPSHSGTRPSHAHRCVQKIARSRARAALSRPPFPSLERPNAGFPCARLSRLSLIVLRSASNVKATEATAFHFEQQNRFRYATRVRRTVPVREPLSKPAFFPTDISDETRTALATRSPARPPVRGFDRPTTARYDGRHPPNASPATGGWPPLASQNVPVRYGL